jgi:uncharacterized membrane protein
MTTTFDELKSARQATPSNGEIWIARLLRAGVALSVLLILAGTLLTFHNHPGYTHDKSSLHTLVGASANFPHTPGDVAAALTQCHGQAIVTLGLLVLIATPFLRVALSAALFWSARDRLYTAITLVVLAILTASILFGRVG